MGMALRLGRTHVPTSSPAKARRIMSFERPGKMRVGMPRWAARLADNSFEYMPPVPTVVLPPHMASRFRAEASSMQGRTSPGTPSTGGFLKTPGEEVRLMSRSAPTRVTRRLARLSLSPNFKPSVETVSFSLTMGTAPQERISVKVLRALRSLWRTRKSSWVRSTWAVGRFWQWKASSQARMSLPWPMAAAP